MGATVTIRRWTGASGSPTRTDITTANTVANAQDTHEAAAATSANPIKIPSAGTNRSFWVATRLSVDVAPSGTIDNIRWHSDGTAGFGTGVSAVVAKASSYVQATGMTGSTGDALNTTNYGSSLSPATPAAYTMYTSGSPLAVTGSVNAMTTTALGSLVVYQLTVTTAASAGATTQETFTWLFDET